MTSVSGYIVRLSPEREELLELSTYESFAEPVPEFQHSRNVPLICFVVSDNGILRWIARGRRGVRAGTDLRRLNLEDLVTLTENVHIDALIERSSKRFKAKLSERLRSGGLLPPKSFQEFLDVLSEYAPRVGSALSGFSEARNRRIRGLGAKARESLAEQKEAVATAMNIAGIDRKELLNWDINESETPSSFLDGLSQVRLREDPMVISDSQVVPGFDAIRTTPFNSVVFENDRRKLTVLITNRQPLEEQLGVDLIYYNETFKSFLMIQYKAMEQEALESVYRFPNQQLDAEVVRMKSILDELRKCSQSADADSFRFSDNPFFLKFCPRIVFKPDDVGLIKGMYLPLDYWDAISNHESMNGPKRGKRIAYSNVRRYFDNTTFLTLASDAWVGTTISQSQQLEVLIRSTIEAGRAVVFALSKDKEERHHGRS
ncbi:hypothetical protein [Marinobacter adhaerens]|uniref:hypothetical protein n=1 Tax=Marinobacter adhaerens TaxID=1033846 RepID=UPI003F6F925A